MNIDIVEIIQLAIILMVSIGLHEYAHAIVSYKLGDPTPKLQNRLTPNPIYHIDPIGFLMIFLVHFGRGKPVQVNPNYYKNPVKGELIVAMAGPATNIILAIFGIFILLIYSKILGFSLAQILMDSGNIVLSFWKLFAFINFALAIFNMLPIPPLDGFRLIKMFWPKQASFIEQHRLYVMIFFFILVLGPGRYFIGNFITGISSFMFDIVFTFFSYVIY